MTHAFTPAWLSADPRALSFLADGFRHPQARAEAVAAATARPIAPALLEALRARQAAWPASPARQRHLDQLGQPGAVVVTTGQQMGLFGGPLFTLYKAAGAVATARQVARDFGRPCVPVFWLQDEDHDLAEIDHVWQPAPNGEPLRIGLDRGPDLDAKVPVAHRVLGPDVVQALEALETTLAGQPHAGPTLALLRAAWQPGRTLSQAFADALATLFADHGLVLLDPRDPAVSRAAAPVHRRLLDQAGPLAGALGARANALQEAGFPVQVHVRPGAPLAFVSPDAVDGPRYRLEPAGQGTWNLVGHPAQRTVTTEQLHAWLVAEPLRFTASALARPLLQDLLLPNVGYVAGPGEIAYLAQLGPAYAHLGLLQPLVLPRPRFRLLDGRLRGLLRSLDLTPADAARPRDDLLAHLAARAAAAGFDPPDAVLQRLTTVLDPELDRLAAAMTALDPNLDKAVARTREGIADALGKLVAKYGRTLAARDQGAVTRLDLLRHLLFPNGEPQERVHGLAAFAGRVGPQALVDAVVAAVRPFADQSDDLPLATESRSETLP